MTSYNPDFSRNYKGKFNLDNNFVSIKNGSEAFITEDELNELQWIQNEQRSQLVRSLFTSGVSYDTLSFSDLNDNKDETIYIKSYGNTDMNNAILFNIKNYIPININGYFIKLAGTYKKDITGLNTSNNNILISLPPIPTSTARYDLVYLEVWFEEIDYQTNKFIKYYGGGSNNDIGTFNIDSRLGVETTRRVQLKWDITTAINAKNMTDNSVFPRNNTINNNYVAASTTQGQIYSKDPNLYISTGNVGAIDKTYYAIPLFSIYRPVGVSPIPKNNYLSLIPIAKSLSKKNELSIDGNNGDTIYIINNNGNIDFKDENNLYIDINVNDVVLHDNVSENNNIILHNDLGTFETLSKLNPSGYSNAIFNKITANSDTNNKLYLKSTGTSTNNYIAVTNSNDIVLSTLGHDGNYWYANGYKIAVLNSSGLLADSKGTAIQINDTSITNSNTFVTISGTNQKLINKSIDSELTSQANTLASHTHSSITGSTRGSCIITSSTSDNNDTAGLTNKNNVDVNTWWGFSVSPSISGKTIPQNTPAFSVDARTGNAYIAGKLYTDTQGIKLGDNITLSDVGIANTMSLKGIGNTTYAGISFGSNNNTVLSANNSGNLYLNSKKILTQDDYNTLFQYADDGKQYWVDVVGSPLSTNDTFATLKSKTQTIKNTIATNITNKGITASGTETLTSLANKISKIQTSVYPSFTFVAAYDNFPMGRLLIEIGELCYYYYNGYIYSLEPEEMAITQVATATFGGITSVESEMFIMGSYIYYGSCKYDMNWNIVNTLTKGIYFADLALTELCTCYEDRDNDNDVIYRVTVNGTVVFTHDNPCNLKAGDYLYYNVDGGSKSFKISTGESNWLEDDNCHIHPYVSYEDGAAYYRYYIGTAESNSTAESIKKIDSSGGMYGRTVFGTSFYIYVTQTYIKNNIFIPMIGGGGSNMATISYVVESPHKSLIKLNLTENGGVDIVNPTHYEIAGATSKYIFVKITDNSSTACYSLLKYKI